MTVEEKDNKTVKVSSEGERVLEVCREWGITEPEEVEAVKRAVAIRQAVHQLEREQADAEKKARRKEQLDDDLITIL